MKIPSDNKWTQTNDGDIFGVLHETRNITLDKQGKVRLSRRPIVRYSSNDDTNFERVLSIVYFNSKYIAVTTDEAFIFDLTGAAGVSEIASTPTTFLGSDAMVWNGNMYVTTSTSFSTYTSVPTWNLNIAPAPLTASVPHPMAVFDSQTTYKLAIGDDDRVQLYDNSATSPAKATTDLILPTEYIVTTLAYANGFLYVGTKNVHSNDTCIFVWDGATTNANYQIPVGASWIYSMIPYKSTIALMTSAGQLLAVSGASVVPLANLPVYYDPNATWQEAATTERQRVFHRGMVAVGDNIYISLDGQLDIGNIPEMQSGLWVYDPQVGLNHRAGLTAEKFVVDSDITESSDIITTAAAHKLKTGDAIEFSTVDTLTGIIANFPYYVDVQSSTTFKIAKTRKALAEGNYVTIGGTAGNDTIYYNPNSEWGVRSEGEGHAICLVNPNDAPRDMWNTPVVWSGRTQDVDGVTMDSLYVFSDSFNVGGFTTQRIYSNSIEETWDKIVVFIDGAKISSESVVVKCKVGQGIGKPSRTFTGTWQSTTTFNDANAALTDEFDDIDIGDEINITDGYGRGYTTHVTDISGTTITVDEAIGTATKTFKFYIDDFAKITSVGSLREIPNYISASLKKPGAWIQIKVELRGFELEIPHMEIPNVARK